MANQALALQKKKKHLKVSKYSAENVGMFENLEYWFTSINLPKENRFLASYCCVPKYLLPPRKREKCSNLPIEDPEWVMKHISKQ